MEPAEDSDESLVDARSAPDAQLTDRERVVRRLVVQRYDNQEIADLLDVSKRTVESHVAALLRKLAVPDRRTLISASGTATFREQLTRMLRSLTSPSEIQEQSAALLGEHLGVDRAYYQEIDLAADTFVIHRDYRSKGPSIAGTYRLSDFSDDPVYLHISEGRTLVVRDAQRELAAEAAAAWAGLSVRAAMAAPNTRNGVCVAALGVTSVRPRDWTLEDVALLEETAERAWIHVERARLEHELGQAREAFRALAGSVAAIVWQAEVSGQLTYANAPFRTLTGLAPGDDVSGVVVTASTGDDPAGSPGRTPGGAPPRGHALVRRTDGAHLAYELNDVPTVDPDGAITGHTVIGVPTRKA